MDYGLLGASFAFGRYGPPLNGEDSRLKNAGQGSSPLRDIVGAYSLRPGLPTLRLARDIQPSGERQFLVMPYIVPLGG